MTFNMATHKVNLVSHGFRLSAKKEAWPKANSCVRGFHVYSDIWTL